MDGSLPAPLSMGFPRQEYWSGLLFPPPGNLPYTRIKPMSLMSPALPDGFFTTSATWDLFTHHLDKYGFPHSSVGKESTCNAGDPSSIPGLGRSAGEGIGYPFQYSWASLVVQLVKNLPATWETWVQSLGWEDPLEKGKATYSSILAWRLSPWGCKELDMTERLSLSLDKYSCVYEV